MSLIDEAMTPCILIEKVRVPDGIGGLIPSYRDGAEFKAAIVYDNSIEARVAESGGVTSLYTVTLPLSADLVYHDVFKRISDGKIFRVTSDSDDKVTPKRSTFQFRQVTAEEWVIPNEQV